MGSIQIALMVIGFLTVSYFSLMITSYWVARLCIYIKAKRCKHKRRYNMALFDGKGTYHHICNDCKKVLGVHSSKNVDLGNLKGGEHG